MAERRLMIEDYLRQRNGDHSLQFGKDLIIIKNLGKGGFGEVLKCFNVNTQETEAVKIIKGKNKRIANHEICILNHLRCLDPDQSNIVKFNNYFYKKKDICLSFELLDTTLDSYVSEVNHNSKTKGLPISEVRVITKQMAVALRDLKAIGIFHGDIKPGNIMIVDRDQQPLQVKLVDFGGAQFVSDVDYATFAYTECYSSPEILLKSSISEAVDVWSLGVTLLEVALGDDLFLSYSHYNVLKNIIKLFEQPPDHVLNKGCLTQAMFNREVNKKQQWTLKPEEQFYREHNLFPPRTRKHFESFNDIKDAFVDKNENDLKLFLELILKMLDVDPERRITPLEILEHLFIVTAENSETRDPKKGDRQIEDFLGLLSSDNYNPAEIILLTDGMLLEPSAGADCTSPVVHERQKETFDEETLQERPREEELDSPEVQLEPTVENNNDSSFFTKVCNHVKDNVGCYGRALVVAAAACSIFMLMRSRS